MERDQQRVLHQAMKRPASAAQQGEHQAFRQKLADDIAAAAAERQADGDFLAAGGAAGQHHIGDVEGRDQQDHAGHGEQEDGGNGEARCPMRGWRKR